MTSPLSAMKQRRREKITLVQMLFAQPSATSLCLPRGWTIATCLINGSQSKFGAFLPDHWSASKLPLDQPRKQTSNTFFSFVGVLWTHSDHGDSPDHRERYLPEALITIGLARNSNKRPLNASEIEIIRDGRSWNGYGLELDERR